MKSIKNFIINTLFGGFLVILPLAIFYFLIKMIFGMVDGLLTPLRILLKDYLHLPISDFFISLIAFAVVILFCFMVGLTVRTRFGKETWSFVEKTYLLKLPLYGAIKETVQQFSGTKKMPFTDVVLVDVFDNGTRMTGFITDEHESGNVTVFVPTGPNPTNGFIFHVQRHQIEKLNDDIKTNEALRTIIGVGVGSKSIMNF